MKLRIIGSLLLVLFLTTAIADKASAYPHWRYRHGWYGPRVAVRVAPPPVAYYGPYYEPRPYYGRPRQYAYGGGNYCRPRHYRRGRY